MKYIFSVLISLLFLTCSAQTMKSDTNPSNLPYYNIPDAPQKYTTGNVIGRTLDGLGYRYFWATEGLTDSELDYKPSDDSRTIQETLKHIYGLSKGCLNAAAGEPNVRPTSKEELSWHETREKTLTNIQKASELFMQMEGDEIKNAKIIFQRGENKSEFPIWNLLNGQLADAIHHTGQVVALRRAAGNPVSPLMNVFTGKTRIRE